MSPQRAAPIVTVHDGIHVVRDDLYPGGTKARFIPTLYADGIDEVVYASPAQGGAQVALATVARDLGKRATIFVARRYAKHPRTKEVIALGAKIVEIEMGYLTAVQAAARRYCETTGATLAPFGMDTPIAVEIIANDARRIAITPDEIWCSASSGTLARALARAWPHARRHVVQVGRALSPAEVDHATIHEFPRGYGYMARETTTPFPSDATYEQKSWLVCRVFHGPGTVLFWNVVGPPAVSEINRAPTGAARKRVPLFA